MSEVEGIVEAVTLLFQAHGKVPMWYQVKLEGKKELFALHTNWFVFYGKLQAGDHVRYVQSKGQLGKGDTQVAGQKGWLLFDELRKIEAEEELEEAEPTL